MKFIRLIFIFLISFSFDSMHATEIDTTEVVKIGGIQQFISIKGKDASKPILLYFHGGPGAAVSSHSKHVTGDLENDFVIVHWDQRNSGKTLSLNVSNEIPSIQLMKQDAEELFLYVLKRFNRKKIVLVGNSWGTLLGFHLSKKFHENISNFVAVSPLVNHKKSQKLTLSLLKAHYKEKENEKAVTQLNSVRIPIISARQMLVLYRWETIYNGGKFSDDQFEQYLGYFKQWEQQWMPLYSEFYTIDLEKEISEITCPLVCIQGAKDLTTHYEVFRSFFNQLEATHKKQIWLNDAGHNIPASHSQIMQAKILEHLVI